MPETSTGDGFPSPWIRFQDSVTRDHYHNQTMAWTCTRPYVMSLLPETAKYLFCLDPLLVRTIIMYGFLVLVLGSVSVSKLVKTSRLTYFETQSRNLAVDRRGLCNVDAKSVSLDQTYYSRSGLPEFTSMISKTSTRIDFAAWTGNVRNFVGKKFAG